MALVFGTTLNFYVLILFSLVFKTSNFGLFSLGKALYDNNDPLVILNNSNLKTTIQNKSNVWIVEFYNSWCGHCVRFAPTWKQLAHDISAWHPVINIAAIDCNDNGAACRQYEILAFPTIKFFPIFSAESDHGTQFSGEMTVDSLRHAMINEVDKVPVKNRPKCWPDFFPCRLTSSAAIWEARRPGVKYIFLIFESKASYLGREVIFDTQKIKKVQVFRVNLYNQDLIKEFGIHNHPSLAVIERNQAHEIKLANQSRHGYVREIENRERVEAADRSKQNEPESKNKTQTSSPSPALASSLDRVYMVDLESALHHSLRNEVTMRKTIHGSHLEALKAFVSVLAKFFPGRPPVMSFLEDIRDWLFRQNYRISSERWLNVINQDQTEKFLPNSTNYIGCRGSLPQYRGYPCGLWMLFHALTVSSASFSAEDNIDDPLQVLHAMLSYILHFFGCDECAQNFRNESATMDHSVNSTDDAILWLWQTHNDVNDRLAGDVTEDPWHLKIQFPPRALCNSCYVSNNSEMSEWNISEVLIFLKKFYSKNNIDMRERPSGTMQGTKSIERNRNWRKISISQLEQEFLSKWKQKKYNFYKNLPISNYSLPKRLARDLFAPQKNIEVLKERELETRIQKRPTSGSWFFSSIDISLCVVIYILSSAILLFVYYIVAVRRKKRKYIA